MTRGDDARLNVGAAMVRRFRDGRVALGEGWRGERPAIEAIDEVLDALVYYGLELRMVEEYIARADEAGREVPADVELARATIESMMRSLVDLRTGAHLIADMLSRLGVVEWREEIRRVEPCLGDPLPLNRFDDGVDNPESD